MKKNIDENKILTVVTANQAKAGDVGWVGNHPSDLRTEINGVKEGFALSAVNPDSQKPFQVYDTGYALFYPKEKELGGDGIKWTKFEDEQPWFQGTCLVICSVASIFGGYYDVFSAFWLYKEKKWLEVYHHCDGPVTPIYWAPMPGIPDDISEELHQ